MAKSMDLDDRAIAALVAQLENPDKPTVRAAVDALIPLAAGSPALCAMLNQRLAEAGHPAGWPIAYVLGNLPQPCSEAIAALLDALDHRDPDIRWAIALLLVRIAKRETSLVDRLVELCAVGSANQKRMALYAIRDLALSDRASRMALLSTVNDTDPSVRVAAAICLKARADIDEDGKDVLLRLYLNDSELKVRHAVAITLATLGSPAPEFLAALERNSKSANEQIKKAAVAALALLK